MKGPIGVIASWQGVRQLAPSRTRASAPGGTLSTMSDMAAIAGVEPEVNSEGATLHPPIPRPHASATIALTARGRQPVRRVAVAGASACARPHPRNGSAGRCSRRISFLLGPVPHTATPHEKLDSQAVAPAIGEHDLALSLHNPRAKQRARFRPHDTVAFEPWKPAVAEAVGATARQSSRFRRPWQLLPTGHRCMDPHGDRIQLVRDHLSRAPASIQYVDMVNLFHHSQLCRRSSSLPAAALPFTRAIIIRRMFMWSSGTEAVARWRSRRCS
jgi:hypothetical protein